MAGISRSEWERFCAQQKSIPTTGMVTKATGKAGGTMHGLALSLGMADGHGDVIVKFNAPAVVPLLVGHFTGLEVGRARLTRTDEGLQADLLFSDDAKGQQAKALAAAGWISGLSAGSDLDGAEWARANVRVGAYKTHRRIAVKVKEVSLVSHPAASACRISGAPVRFIGNTFDSLRAAHGEGLSAAAILDAVPARNEYERLGKASLIAYVSGAYLEDTVAKAIREGAAEGRALADAFRRNYLMLDGNVC